MISFARTRWLPVFAGVLCSLVVSSCSAPPQAGPKTDNAPAAVEAPPDTESAARPNELLPDIVPAPPTGMVVAPDESGGFRLAFDTKFDNLGDGPLRIEGHKEDASGSMTADQVVFRPDGSKRVREGVGEIRFAESGNHRHWHFFRFMRYELARPSDGELAAPDRKTGFCIGDRYNADPGVSLPGEPPMPGVYDAPPDGDWCGRDDADRSRMTMGLSVGYGDDYEAFIDGQFIEVTDVPDGRYFLVHRVNASLVESDYSNNAASVLLELSRPYGPGTAPAVTVLATCPNSASCSG